MEDENSHVIRPGLWAHSKHISEIKKKLCAKVPKITLHDIRMERQAFHEVILTDLYESGYQQTARFIQYLIDMEEYFKTMKKLSERYLTTNAGRCCLQTIADHLKSSELNLHEGRQSDSIEAFLELAQLLANQKQHLWIIEQIYIETVKVSKLYTLDGGLLEAQVRYYYGRFLVEKCGIYDAAYETLKISHDMSIARDWSIMLESGMEANLGQEVSYLLFLCLSNRAEGQPLVLAREFSKRALKYALASEYKCIIPRAYLERGDREMDSKNYEEATNFFSRAITFAQVSNQSNFIYQGYLKKGYALQKSNRISQAATFAKLAKRTAYDSGSSYNLAKAYMLYGEVSIGRNLMNVATYNFIMAANIFNELKKFQLSRKARFHGAFAISNIVLEQLVDLIQKSDPSETSDSFDKIVQWKVRKVPFWNVESKCRVSDLFDLDRRKSTLAAFWCYEKLSFLDNREFLLTGELGSNKHNYRKWREWLSTY